MLMSVSEKWHGQHISRSERTRAILSVGDSDVEGFYFKNPVDALSASKRVLRQNKFILLPDIDDTIFHSEPWIRAKLNDLIAQQDPNFVPVSIDEVKATPVGRYYQVERYQAVAKNMGLRFLDLFLKVQNDEELHAMMMPTPDRLDLIESFQDEGFAIGGYPTARPSLLAKVTSSALKYYGFPNAPVIDVNADSGRPANSKVEFFRSLLAGEETHQKKIAFLDDDVDTVIAVKKEFPQLICVVPTVQRNNNRVNSALDAVGVIYGSPKEIKQMISSMKN